MGFIAEIPENNIIAFTFMVTQQTGKRLCTFNTE